MVNRQEIIEKILLNIKNGKLKQKERILTEREFLEEFNCSKETIRKAITYLVNQNILFSIQGKGVYVSAFSDLKFNFNSISNNKDFYKEFSRHSINYKIPIIIKINSPFPFEYKDEEFLKYIKLYFNGEQTVFYTINWILNLNKLKLTEEELIRQGKKRLFDEKLIKKIYHKSILTKQTKFDKFLFNSNNQYYPTTFNYFFDKNENLIGFSLVKTFPNYFKIEHIKNIIF